MDEFEKMKRDLVWNEAIEQAAKRVETYAFALEIEQHIGQPTAQMALLDARIKIRELKRIV